MNEELGVFACKIKLKSIKSACILSVLDCVSHFFGSVPAEDCAFGTYTHDEPLVWGNCNLYDVSHL